MDGDNSRFPVSHLVAIDYNRILMMVDGGAILADITFKRYFLYTEAVKFRLILFNGANNGNLVFKS